MRIKKLKNQKLQVASAFPISSFSTLLLSSLFYSSHFAYFPFYCFSNCFWLLYFSHFSSLLVCFLISTCLLCLRFGQDAFVFWEVACF